MNRSNFIDFNNHILTRSEDVRIDEDCLSAYAESLSKPDFVPNWREYASTNGKDDIESAFYDLALNAAQNSGYYAVDSNGKFSKWELDGSGAKALVQKLDELETVGLRPTLHGAQVDINALKKSISSLPYADERMAIFSEFNAPKNKDELIDIFRKCVTVGEEYIFSFENLKKLSDLMICGFGKDPFKKKLFLTPVLMAGFVYSFNGHDVKTEGLAPADYRIPQTLHNIGILRFSDRLVNFLDREEIMPENSEYVRSIRAASIISVEKILQLRPDIKLHHIDGDLWYKGRKPEALDQIAEQFSQKSSFSSKYYMKRSKKPMIVPTMHF